MKVLAQKIFQNLLANDIPAEVFEKAVQLSLKKPSEKPKPCSSENQVQRLLDKKSCLSFIESSFLQLIFNQIEETRQALFMKKDMLQKGENVVANQQIRTFRVLFTQGDKNSDL